MLISITYLKIENLGTNGCHNLLTEFLCDALGNKAYLLFYLYDPFPYYSTFMTHFHCVKFFSWVSFGEGDKSSYCPQKKKKKRERTEKQKLVMSRCWDLRFPMIGPQARKQSSALQLSGVGPQNKTNQTKQEASRHNEPTTTTHVHNFLLHLLLYHYHY